MREILIRLQEMARSRKDILTTLNSSRGQRIENLVKIFLFRDRKTVHHWTSELYAVCHDMDKCKINNKYLDYKTVSQELWYSWSDCYNDRHDNYCEDVARGEKMEIPHHNHKRMYEFMRDYHLWLSRELSSRGTVRFSEVNSKIQELLRKYSL